MSTSPFKVAAVQATPVFLDREATVEKACGLIAQAGENGARIVAFPEAFIPAYPDWAWAVPAGQDEILADLYAELNAYDTPLGKLGGLICWENYMPLARYAMYAWGVQIYVAATWARGEPWLSTIRHIAKEGGVYVISACIAMRKDDIPDRYAFKTK